MSDPMSQKVCLDCSDKLETTHALIASCLKADTKLRKCLNIEPPPVYDCNYNELVHACSLEVVDLDGICMDEPTQFAHQIFPEGSSKKIGNSHELPKLPVSLDDIGNNPTSPANFENRTGCIFHPAFQALTECYSKLNNEKHNSAMKDTNVVEKMKENSAIFCPLCEGTFTTQEIFEHHKFLCDEESSMIIRKDNSVRINCTFGELVANGNDEKLTEYKCENCKKEFDNEKLLSDHKLLHCKYFPRTHSQQPAEFGTIEEKLNLSKAENNIDDNVQVELSKRCGHCEAIRSNKKELLKHIIECHNGQLLFKCFACEKTYEKWSGLDVHEATHRLDKPYLCDLCGKSFKHSNNLRGHKRTHLDESKKKRHVCEICSSPFRSRFHLREHMNQHDDNKPYSCEQCGKAFHKRIQLRQHGLSHGSNKHVCRICGASFNRRGNMIAHLKRHNDGYGTYTCSVCAQRFETMSELKLHRKVHTREDIVNSVKRKCVGKMIWECKLCDRVFPKRAILLYHERTHTGDRMTVECEECGKKLSSQKSLSYHKKSMHSIERQHMCQYCGEAFVAKEARLIHERIHTGERPYICKICNMRYKCSSNLNQHMKTHSSVKPHKCSFCGKSFARKDTLTVHERTHTGVKPFPCEICGRPFSQKNDMLKHAKTHDVKAIRCERCNDVFTKKKDIFKHLALHEQDPLESQNVQLQNHAYNVDPANSSQVK